MRLEARKTSFTKDMKARSSLLETFPRLTFLHALLTSCRPILQNSYQLSNTSDRQAILYYSGSGATLPNLITFKKCFMVTCFFAIAARIPALDPFQPGNCLPANAPCYDPLFHKWYSPDCCEVYVCRTKHLISSCFVGFMDEQSGAHDPRSAGWGAFASELNTKRTQTQGTSGFVACLGYSRLQAP